MLLKECKNVAKEKKISKYFIDDTGISFDSDEENSNEKNYIEENSDE